MKRGATATAAVALLAFCAAAPARADVALNGIAIGTPLSALVRALGPPATVTSDDSGNRFVFAAGTTAFTDDDGLLLAVALQNGCARIEVDGTPRAFTIGSYSAARADAELADIAEFAMPTLRSYRLAPRRDLVLAFDEATHRLERVTYGEPGQLARLGLLPGDPATKAVVYRAPQLRRPDPAAKAAGPFTAVYRIAVDRGGAVTSVEVAIPSGASDDDDSARRLRQERYLPAQLDGRPIAATIFVAVRH